MVSKMASNLLNFLKSNCLSFNVAYYGFKENKKVTYFNYEDIQDHALELSNALNSLNSFYETSIVACFVKPNVTLPSIILGILQSSSAFTFLDLENTCESLKYLQEYLCVKTLLIQLSHYEKLQHHLCSCWTKSDKIIFKGTIPLTFLEATKCTLESCPNSKDSNLHIRKDKRLAYVMQTSGTTGRCKIVQVPHGCIVPNIEDLAKKFMLSKKDVILQCAPLTFDPCIVEVFLAIACGATLVIVEDKIKVIPAELAHVITDAKVTAIQATPSLILSLGQDYLKNNLLATNSPLCVLAFGGESIPLIDSLKYWKADGNKTRIFNLYGLTEVSCWATCHEVDFKNSDTIPIGLPLAGTRIEVKDGELLIGGDQRWCVINDEPWPEISKDLIRTGDLVERNSRGELCWLSRKDGIFKHHGKKVDFSHIKQILDGMAEIITYKPVFLNNCLFVYVLLNEMSKSEKESKSLIRSRLTGSVKNMPTTFVVVLPYLPLTSHGKIDGQKIFDFNVFGKKEDKCVQKRKSFSERNISEIIQDAWKDCLNCLPCPSDNFILCGGNSISAVIFVSTVELELQTYVPHLLTTLLNEPYQTVLETTVKHIRTSTEKSSKDFSSNYLVKDLLSGVSEDISLKTRTKKTSKSWVRRVNLKAKKHANELSSKKMNFEDFNDSHEPLVNNMKIDYSYQSREYITKKKALDDFHQFQELVSQKKALEDFIQSHEHVSKKKALKDFIQSREPVSKKVAVEDISCFHDTSVKKKCDKTSMCCEVWTRRGYELNCCRRDTCASHKKLHFDSSNDWNIRIKKAIKLNKCVDASPCVVHLLGSGEIQIFIGSHLGTVCILRKSGADFELSKFRVPGRIESSPCISACGQYFLFGSYNHKLYCCNIYKEPKYKWTFESEGEIKCSPVVSRRNVVYFGTYCKHLYAIDVETGRVLWKTQFCTGNIYSSPALSEELGIVVAASLDGIIGAFKMDTGVAMWTYKHSAFFSSPLVTDDSIFIGTTSKSLLKLSLSGVKVDEFNTQGPIFSSPARGLLLTDHLYFGCHDNHLYCTSLATNQPLWKTKLDSAIFATPCVFVRDSQEFVSTVSSSGVISVVSGLEGKTVCCYVLPKECFSSPVVAGSELYVGCRDNTLYCLDLCAERSTDELSLSDVYSDTDDYMSSGTDTDSD